MCACVGSFNYYGLSIIAGNLCLFKSTQAYDTCGSNTVCLFVFTTCKCFASNCIVSIFDFCVFFLLLFRKGNRLYA